MCVCVWGGDGVEASVCVTSEGFGKQLGCVGSRWPLLVVDATNAINIHELAGSLKQRWFQTEGQNMVV